MSKKYIVSFLVVFVLFLSGCGKKAEAPATPTPTPTSGIKMIKEGEGPKVDLLPRADKKAVTLSIKEIPSEYTKIEYEIVYDTDGVQRGVLGSTEVKGGVDVNKEVLLASCSKNVCVFDKNVSKLTLTVKFTGTAEPAQFQKDFSL